MQRFQRFAQRLIPVLGLLAGGCATVDTPGPLSSPQPRTPGSAMVASPGAERPAKAPTTTNAPAKASTGSSAPAPVASASAVASPAKSAPEPVPATPTAPVLTAPVTAAVELKAAEPARAEAGETAAAMGKDPAPASAPAARPEPEPDLWERIRAGFAMPALPTPLVNEKEQFYLSKPEYLQRMFQRGGRYLFHIVEEVEKRGMPTELALLPFVESAMNPVALSPAQAAGLWQFIPSTGKAYDLRQDWWVDNRRDVVKSTQAALDYLQKIYAMHGNDWFLALASYNWGEGSVARAIKKNQAMGKPTDYLNLSMPNETRHYVPKLIALKNLLLNANSLGLKLPDLPNRPYFVTLEKTRPIDLQLAAQFAKMSVEEFVALNPAHNRPVISARRNNEIKLPADRIEHFKAAMARHEADSKAFATWQPYTLRSGETLDTIAGRTGVQISELRRANGLRDGARIVAGTQLLAPQKGVVDEQRVESFVAPRVYEQIDRPAQYHTVGKRESLASIAGRYGISAATLAAWNGVRKGVGRGMRLLVQPASTQTMLTNESGERSMVAQASSRPTPVDSPAPEADKQTRDESPRLIKVAAEPARPAAAGRVAPAVVAARAAPATRAMPASRQAMSAQAPQARRSDGPVSKLAVMRPPSTRVAKPAIERPLAKAERREAARPAARSNGPKIRKA